MRLAMAEALLGAGGEGEKTDFSVLSCYCIQFSHKKIVLHLRQSFNALIGHSMGTR